MHVHAHAGTRVHEATSLTGLVPERVQLTVHTTEPTGTVPEPFHCDHIARWSARSGTSGRSGTGLNTGNWNGSRTVLVSNLWCEHGLIRHAGYICHITGPTWSMQNNYLVGRWTPGTGREGQCNGGSQGWTGIALVSLPLLVTLSAAAQLE